MEIQYSKKGGFAIIPEGKGFKVVREITGEKTGEFRMLYEAENFLESITFKNLPTHIPTSEEIRLIREQRRRFVGG